jgi:hypothetical protein
MSNEAIRNLLQELHRTLSGSTSISTEDRELLRQLSADIQALLAQPGATTPAGRRSLADQLMAAVTRFEVSHPDLTATMAQVSTALADMGI